MPDAPRAFGHCEHLTVEGHLPYDGKAECLGCERTVWLHDPKRGPSIVGAIR